MDKYYDIYYKHIKQMLDRNAISVDKKYVLYPNGKIANIVRTVLLKEYSIEPVFFIDNYKFDGKWILNFEQAKTKKDDYIYLICSDKEEIFDSIRRTIRGYVKIEKIIDLFPKETDEIYEERVNSLLDELENEIGE